jgi:hypothetical protein
MRYSTDINREAGAMAQVAMSETAYEKLDALTQEAFGTWQAAHPEMRPG